MLKNFLVFVSIMGVYVFTGPGIVVGLATFWMWLIAKKHMGPVHAYFYAWLLPATIWHFAFCRITGRSIGNGWAEELHKGLSYLQPKVCLQCRAKENTTGDRCYTCGGELVLAHEDPKSKNGVSPD